MKSFEEEIQPSRDRVGLGLARNIGVGGFYTSFYRFGARLGRLRVGARYPGSAALPYQFPLNLVIGRTRLIRVPLAVILGDHGRRRSI